MRSPGWDGCNEVWILWERVRIGSMRPRLLELPAAERLRRGPLPLLRLQQRQGGGADTLDTHYNQQRAGGKPVGTGAAMIMTLADLHPGQSASVIGLKDLAAEDRQVRKYLTMGLVPGAEITLVQRFPAYVFEMGYSQFAIDRELASAVLVKLEGHDDDDG